MQRTSRSKPQSQTSLYISHLRRLVQSPPGSGFLGTAVQHDDARCGKFEKIREGACRVVERRSEPRPGELSLHILLGELRAALGVAADSPAPSGGVAGPGRAGGAAGSDPVAAAAFRSRSRAIAATSILFFGGMEYTRVMRLKQFRESCDEVADAKQQSAKNKRQQNLPSNGEKFNPPSL
jgi:hypothetical protein